MVPTGFTGSNATATGCARSGKSVRLFSKGDQLDQNGTVGLGDGDEDQAKANLLSMAKRSSWGLTGLDFNALRSRTTTRFSCVPSIAWHLVVTTSCKL
jgi:hypothetical protein